MTGPAASGCETMPVMDGRADIILIGFMGAGKTTVGRALAARLYAAFTDLDSRIERATALTVPQIFAQQGEPAFRRLEAEQLSAWLSDSTRGVRVLAVGGGAVEDPTVRTLLENSGATVLHLTAPLETMLARCVAQNSERPLLSEAAERFARRDAIYQQLGVPVDTAGATPDAIAERIAASIEVAA